MGEVVLCSSGGLSFVEVDEIGLPYAPFDQLGLKAYAPLLISPVGTNQDQSSSLPIIIIASAVPVYGGLGTSTQYPEPCRVHNDLLQWLINHHDSPQVRLSKPLLNNSPSGSLVFSVMHCVIVVDDAAIVTATSVVVVVVVAAAMMMVLKKIAGAASVVVEVEVMSLLEPNPGGDLEHALQRRMDRKWAGVGCTLLVSIMGKTHMLLVKRIQLAAPEERDHQDRPSSKIATATTLLYPLTRNTRWRLVSGLPNSCLDDQQPLSSIERQIQTLLGRASE